MNKTIKLTQDEALRCAIIYTNIGNDEPVCISGNLADGLFHFIVTTLYLRYEFYVDAVSGEILGISTEPLSYLETLRLCTDGEPLPYVA